LGDVIFKTDNDTNTPTITNGDPALDADGNPLLFNGADPIYVFVSSDGHTLVGSTNSALTQVQVDAYAVDPTADPDGFDGSIIYNIVLDPGNDSYKFTMVQESVLNAPGEVFDAANAIGGANTEYFAIFGASNTIDALLTAANTGVQETVNTNNVDIGVDTGQSIGGSQTPLEQLRIDFYDDIIDTGGPSEAGDFDVGTHVFTDTFTQSVNFVSSTPGGNTADITSFHVAAVTTAPEGADDFIYIGDTVGLPEATGSANEGLVFITEVTLVLEDGTVITATRDGLDGGDFVGTVNPGETDEETNVTFVDFLEDGTVVLDGLSASAQSPSSYTIKTAAAVTGTTMALTLATTLAALGFVAGDAVTLNAVTYTVVDPNLETLGDLISTLDGATDASVNLNSDGEVVIIGTETDSSLSLSGDLGSLGLSAGTYDPDGFSAVQVSSITGEQAFKLGTFSIGAEAEQPPINLQYELVGTDQDGDSVESVLNATILPDGDNPDTFIGDAGGTPTNDVLIGNDSNNFIAGLEGNDELHGLLGDDELFGGDGDDILYGGEPGVFAPDGLDTLTGGDGADTFVLTDVSIADVIVDYNFAEGDMVDLSGLFTTDLDGSDGNAGNDLLSEFVQLSGNNLQVDVDGGVDNFVTIATLDATAGVTIIFNDDDGGNTTTVI
jgi:hypothetical protein